MNTFLCESIPKTVFSKSSLDWNVPFLDFFMVSGFSATHTSMSTFSAPLWSLKMQNYSTRKKYSVYFDQSRKFCKHHNMYPKTLISLETDGRPLIQSESQICLDKKIVEQRTNILRMLDTGCLALPQKFTKPYPEKWNYLSVVFPGAGIHGFLDGLVFRGLLSRVFFAADFVRVPFSPFFLTYTWTGVSLSQWTWTGDSSSTI